MRKTTFYSRRRSKTGIPIFNNANRVARILFRLSSYARISAHMIRSGAPVIDIIRSQFPLVTPCPAYPVLITVELTNHCNVRCVYCTNPLGLRERGYMTDGTFTTFIEGIKRLKINRVRVVGNGEPTLHPEFAGYIKRIARAGPYLQVLSNGQWRDPQRIIRALLDAPANLIEVTVEGTSRDRYERSSVGAGFERLLQNLSLLKREKEAAGSRAIINLRVMVRPSDRHREKEIKRFWKKYGDTVMLQNLVVQKGLESVEDLYRPVQFDDQSYPVCALPFNAMGVNWNGDAPLCYNSILQYEPPGLILGNLGDTGLADIWNGDVLTQYREAHHKRIPELMPLCKGCTAV